MESEEGSAFLAVVTSVTELKRFLVKLIRVAFTYPHCRVRNNFGYVRISLKARANFKTF